MCLYKQHNHPLKPGNFFHFSLSCTHYVLTDNPAAKEIFEERCHRCHELPDPATAPAMRREKRLKIMAKLSPE